MKIVVIEGDSEFRIRMASFLGKIGLHVESFGSVEVAVDSVAFEKFDFIIFNLSTLDQVEKNFLRFLRHSQLHTKTLLTYDPRVNLELDQQGTFPFICLPKPYDFKSLSARLTRVRQQYQLAEEGIQHFQELRVDVKAKNVRINNQEVLLSEQEFDLLQFLLTNKQKLLSKHAIAQSIGYKQTGGDTDFGFLYALINSIRRKIKAAGGADYIQTVPGIGYRLGE